MGLLRGTQFPEVSRKDRKFLGRTSPAEDIEVVAANGSRVRDARGRTYIDCQLGWSVGSLGWNPPEILARVRAFEGPTYVAPGMLYEPWAELAEQLVEVTPGKLAKAYRCVSGTEAVELALQIAVTSTGRHKFVALEDAYHGNSFGARSLVGHPLAAHLVGCKRLAPPLDASALDRLETQLREREIAAFIMEPVITNLAVTIPDADFMNEVVDLCHRYGTVVIMDEVASAFGRTGKLFATEHYDLAPDIMTLGKAITSGVAPLATTLVTNEIAKTVDGELDFYSTYGWHPVAVEAALATLAYWREHKNMLLANIAARSAELRHQLSIMDFATDAVDLRIQGLAIGIGVGTATYASTIERRCREHGLLLYADGDSIVMFPALTIDHDTLQEVLDILAAAVRG